MAPNRLLLLIGGARSGKSALAVQLASSSGAPVSYIATATAGDGDMAQRILRHQAERPAAWTTIEAPLEVARAVAALDRAGTVVVDCLTLWISNLVFDGRSDSAIEAEAEALAGLLATRAGLSVAVSNEVGLGIHPPSELGRRYRDLLGRCNQMMATRAGRSLFLVAGRALVLHDPLELLPDGVLAPGSGSR
jgi:adenosyl cobinamide kinase/adenosyl cobinamide phosphate guanylyltransferase